MGPALRRGVPDDASHRREHTAPCPGHDKARLHGFTRECRKRRCMEILGNQSAGISSSGTGNEGVGEHVRTRFHLGFGSPVKLRTSEIRTERRKLVSSAGPVFEMSEALENTIQPFGLMSG